MAKMTEKGRRLITIHFPNCSREIRTFIQVQRYHLKVMENGIVVCNGELFFRARDGGLSCLTNTLFEEIPLLVYLGFVK